MRCHTADRGSATVYAVMAAFVLLLTAAVILAGIELARIQHRAAAAADLAALSGAAAVAVGSDGCAAAARIATANGARVTSCVVDGGVVDVVVEVSSRRLWDRSWTLRQRARAGPAS